MRYELMHHPEHPEWGQAPIVPSAVPIWEALGWLPAPSEQAQPDDAQPDEAPPVDAGQRMNTNDGGSSEESSDG